MWLQESKALFYANVQAAIVMDGGNLQPYGGRPWGL